MKYQEALSAFGFSTNEAKVYIAALELGSASAPQIAKKAGLLRTTCYEILKILINKGVANYVILKKVKHFEVVDPRYLLKLMDEKKEKLSSVIDDLLKIRKSVSQKPPVELYEGKEGFRTILDEILNIESGEEYLAIGNNEKFRELLNANVSDFIEKRKKKNIKCRLIIEPGLKSKNLINLDNLDLRTTKMFSELKDVNSEFFLYKDKFVILTLINENPIAIVIQEKSIVDFFKIIFNKLWEIKN